jgi:UDP-2-acetamido-2-deoxy-ribo-hexuluronate aminotransferase
MDLLLDVNIIVDICAPREEFEEAARDAVAFCSQNKGKLWIYAGSVQTLEYTLAREIKRQSAAREIETGNQMAIRLARALLKEFTSDKNWLAALAGEGNVFSTPDPEDEQLIRALDRFPPGSTRLLTRDRLLLDNYPEKTISPAEFCRTARENRHIPFIDLGVQQDGLRPELENRVHTVLHHGQYIMGPEVRELEDRLNEFTGTSHCITCSSGTDALLIALMALDIGPGDEVITVPYTWISTAEVIALLGAKPVFTDILPDTMNMDPARVEQAITSRTKAIMPVSIYGQCADMTTINAIAAKYDLPVIEDGAQSFGATHHGRKSCALSTIGCTSFFPSKPLGCYGDGGAIFTDNEDLADKMRQIRIHGQKVKHQHPLVGINGRLDTIQAAILLEKLKVFPVECELRARAAKVYNALMQDIQGIRTPAIARGNDSVYAQYTILAEDRDRVSSFLKKAKIPAVAYYTAPLHQQGAFSGLGHKPGDFPVSEKVASECLSLPMNPYLTEEEQTFICQELIKSIGA